QSGLGLGIFVSIEHPTRLAREISSRRAEYVDQQVGAGPHGFRRMQHSSRDDGDRRRPAGLMIVRAPFVSVLRPGPAQMMHVGPFETKRALLKVGMGMRRKLAAIARPVAWVDVIDHEVGR